MISVGIYRSLPRNKPHTCERARPWPSFVLVSRKVVVSFKTNIVHFWIDSFFHHPPHPGVVMLNIKLHTAYKHASCPEMPGALRMSKEGLLLDMFEWFFLDFRICGRVSRGSLVVCYIQCSVCCNVLHLVAVCQHLLECHGRICVCLATSLSANEPCILWLICRKRRLFNHLSDD